MRRSRRQNQQRQKLEVFRLIEAFERVSMQNYYTDSQLGTDIRARYPLEYYIGASYACYALGIAIITESDMRDQINSRARKWPLNMQFGSRATNPPNTLPNPPAVGMHIMVTEYRPMGSAISETAQESLKIHYLSSDQIKCQKQTESLQDTAS